MYEISYLTWFSRLLWIITFAPKRLSIPAFCAPVVRTRCDSVKREGCLKNVSDIARAKQFLILFSYFFWSTAKMVHLLETYLFPPSLFEHLIQHDKMWDEVEHFLKFYMFCLGRMCVCFSIKYNIQNAGKRIKRSHMNLYDFVLVGFW